MNVVLNWLERYRIPLLIVCGFLFVVLVWAIVDRAHDSARPLELVATDAPPGGLKVEVTGAVQKPGVYSFQPGARIADALAAAGGPSQDAALAGLNLASRLRDEQRLVVLTREQLQAVSRESAAPVAAARTSGTSAPTLIDLNSASQRALESLPGIGTVRAQRIVESRMAEGPFGRPEDLVVRGVVPQSIFEDIRTLVIAGPPP